MNTMHPVVGLGSKMQDMEKDAATLRQEEYHMKGVDCIREEKENGCTYVGFSCGDLFSLILFITREMYFLLVAFCPLQQTIHRPCVTIIIAELINRNN